MCVKLVAYQSQSPVTVCIKTGFFLRNPLKEMECIKMKKKNDTLSQQLFAGIHAKSILKLQC